MSRLITLVGLLMTILAGCQVTQLTEAEKRARNLEFDKVDRAYAPKPVDLRGKNVLYFSFRNEFATNEQFDCRDACRYLIDGTTGARMYYGVSEWPKTPDFSAPIDLHTLVQGQFTAGHDIYHTNLRPRGAGETAPRIDYVLIEQRQGITPVLTQILPDYGLSRDDGEAWEVFARVDNDRAFQLAPSNALYIDFGRDTRLQNHNSYHGTYYNPYTRITRDEERALLRDMFCGAGRKGACAY